MQCAGLIRDGDPVENFQDLRLKHGDRLLIEGPWEALDTITDARGTLVLLRTPDERKQTPPALHKFGTSLVILAAMVVLSALDVMPVTLAVLLAAIGAIVFKTLSADQAYKTINIPTLVLIAGMLPLADALDQTGGSDFIVAVVTILLSPLIFAF